MEDSTAAIKVRTHGSALLHASHFRSYLLPSIVMGEPILARDSD